MAKLTAVMPAKNEKGKIERCLESLRNFVDEIVIVDSGGTDGTVEICKRYGAKIIAHKMEGYNMDKQRNIGIENATGEWILQTESDEVFPPQTADKIRKALENPGDYVGFRILRRTFIQGHPLRYAGTYGYMLRIFKKGKALYTGSHLHENLKIDGPVADIGVEVYHYTLNSIAQFMQKCNLFSDAESEVFLKENPTVDMKEIKYRLTWKSLKLFWKLYVKKKGYKDGMYGLVWCILNVIAPQIRWLKIWERAVKEGRLKK